MKNIKECANYQYALDALEKYKSMTLEDAIRIFDGDDVEAKYIEIELCTCHRDIYCSDCVFYDSKNVAACIHTPAVKAREAYNYKSAEEWFNDIPERIAFLEKLLTAGGNK